MAKNNMDKEDYVSLEVAKLLKEKGYNEPCYKMYNEEEDCYNYSCYTISKKGFCNSDLCDYEVAVPSLYEAQKWIRVHHKILVTPYYIGRKEYTYHINYMDVKNYYCNNNKAYSSYELAFNEGILEALKLI